MTKTNSLKGLNLSGRIALAVLIPFITAGALVLIVLAALVIVPLAMAKLVFGKETAPEGEPMVDV